jgi:hypothetical protein
MGRNGERMIMPWDWFHSLLKTHLPYYTSTDVLCKTSGDLSLQQLTAFSSLLSAQKSIFYQKPDYLANRLELRTEYQSQIFPRRQNNMARIHSNLTLARGGFFYRSAALFNKLPDELRSPMEPDKFRTKVKQWVKDNIPVKPG